MATIGQEAQAYTPPQTKNICELEKVSIDKEVVTRTKKEGTPDEFTYKCIVEKYEGTDQDFRVPNSVLGAIKTLKEKYPSMQNFSVLREGTGMSTKYQVIPLDGTQETKTETVQ